MSADEQDYTFRTRPGVTTKVRFDDIRRKARVRAQTTTAIPQSFLDARAAERSVGGRAPLGDSHGAFQKIAEIPLALLAEKIPPDAWDDQAALRKLLNDPEFKKFRSDAEGRKF